MDREKKFKQIITNILGSNFGLKKRKKKSKDEPEMVKNQGKKKRNMVKNQGKNQ